MKDIIVIGAGPAGLAAAAYAIRKRLDVLVVSPDVGGKTNHALTLPWTEEHQVIRAKEVVESFKRELDYIGFSHNPGRVKHVDAAAEGFTVHLLSGKTESCRALVLATGIERVPLDVPGEVKYLSRGLGYSLVSYSHLFIDRSVFLTGNGPRVLRSAFEVAIHASRVTVNLEPAAEFDAETVKSLGALHNVTIIPGGTVTEFRGREFAEEVVVRHDDGTIGTIRADGFFVEREPVPSSLPFAHLVSLDERGRVVVDIDARTSRIGIFAAGDLTNVRQEQVLIALGEGAKAALAAYEYLLSINR
ncbi:MAG TPA: NAD(P)/FAD-dependent oxidoreductase [Spirochaetia bacterium]|nr:NAD(P)/FAD-dependent oxidoreductase [Spirochaetia bacterium]